MKIDNVLPSALPEETASCEPAGDIGVLLVHGIGDHREGETLGSFGEPLIDWLRCWLGGPEGKHCLGTVRVVNARLRANRTESESPAFGVAEVQVTGADGTQLPVERWLFAEAWWGETVTPPRSFRLLKWLLSRGPLLVYWHFYFGPLSRQGMFASYLHFFHVVVAFCIASLLQTAVLIAMALWVIPIGPWRRGLAQTVRTLTLTLGDSYVLLEEDFQSAALVTRVARTIDWLQARVSKIVVVAHSQGGAIAHEALRGRTTDKVKAFVSIGSGLEKLQFLRLVRARRKGLLAASLPTIFIALAVYVATAKGAGIAIPGFLLFGALMSAGYLGIILEEYQAGIRSNVGNLDLGANGDLRWFDLYATRDLVPMGNESILAMQSFVDRDVVQNERSYLRDHIGYFQNPNDCLAVIWTKLAAYSTLAKLFECARPAVQQLRRAHYWHCIAASTTTGLAWLTVAAFAVEWRKEVVQLGDQLAASARASNLSLLTVPLQAVRGVIDWIFPGNGGPVESNLLGFGSLIVFSLTWLALFKWMWISAAFARFRRFARDSAAGRVREPHRLGIGLAVVFWCALGAMPFVGLIASTTAPGVVTLSSVSWLLQTLFGLMLLLVSWMGVFAPWVDDQPRMPDVDAPPMPTEVVDNESVANTVFAPIRSLFAVGVTSLLAPAALPEGTLTPIANVSIFYCLLAYCLSWALRILTKIRRHHGIRDAVLIVGVPLAVVVLYFSVGPSTASFPWLVLSLPVYIAATLTLLRAFDERVGLFVWLKMTIRTIGAWRPRFLR